MDKNIINKASSSGYASIVLKTMQQILAFGAVVLLVRTLSQEDYGVYSILYGTIPLINIVASLGLPSVLLRYLPEYYSKNEFILAARLVGFASVARIVSSALILAAVIVYWETFAGLLKVSEYREYFVVFAICILAFQQMGLLRISVESHFLHKGSFILQICAVSVRAVGYGVCFAAGLGLLEIIVIDTTANLFLMLGYTVLYRRRVPRHLGDQSRFEPSERKRVVRYGAFSNFNDVGGQLLNANVNYLIIAYFLSPLEVGIYAFCHGLVSRIDRVSPIRYLATVIRPAFISIGVQSSPERIRNMIQFLVKLVGVFFAPVFCFFYLVGGDFIELVFDKFQQNANIFVLILGFAAINAMAFPIGLAAELRERADIILYSKVFGLFSLAISLIAIPRFGIAGAVFAVGIGTFLKNVFIFWFVRKEFPARPLVTWGARTAVFWTVVAVLTSFLIEQGMPLQNLILASVCFLFGGALYFHSFVGWDETERRFLLKLLDRKGLRLFSLIVVGRTVRNRES